MGDDLKDVQEIKVDPDNERAALDQLDEKVEEEKVEDKSAEEVDEDEEIVSEIEEEEEEETDEEVKDNLYKRLKAKDKNIFKEIPELKEVIFREAALTERFPTVKDADEALEAIATLNQYNEDILSGNSETILESLQSTSKESLNTFVANLIPTIEKIDKNLYYEMISPELKKLFRIFAKNPDERISVSAQNLHYAVFGDDKLDKDVGLKPREGKVSEAEEKLSKREQELEQRVFSNFAGDVKRSCESRIKKSISSAFSNSGLSTFMVDTLTDKILARVGEELEQDSRHMGAINSLWRQAKSANYSTEWKDRIVNAYLSRAKAVVGKHRQKVLADAKLSVKSVEGQLQSDKKRVTPTNQSARIGGSIDSRKIDWSKTDERAALDGNIVYKK